MNSWGQLVGQGKVNCSDLQALQLSTVYGHGNSGESKPMFSNSPPTALLSALCMRQNTSDPAKGKTQSGHLYRLPFPCPNGCGTISRAAVKFVR